MPSMKYSKWVNHYFLLLLLLLWKLHFSNFLFFKIFLGWSCEAKYAILITDAYPHGNRYAKNNSGDRYPAGDP